MKRPNFSDMTDLITEWYGTVSEYDGTEEEIVEKTCIDMIHGYLLLGMMKATREIIKVGGDLEFVKTLIDESIHNLQSDYEEEVS